MERAIDVVYQPIPLSGLVHVWGIYFTLSKSIGNLIIFRTALDEVVQG